MVVYRSGFWRSIRVRVRGRRLTLSAEVRLVQTAQGFEHGLAQSCLDGESGGHVGSARVHLSKRRR